MIIVGRGMRNVKKIAPNGIPELGGGYHLAPQPDMWNGGRVLDAAWIDECTAGHGRLAPLDRTGHPSGCFWGRQTYGIGERDVETIEARGNGGRLVEEGSAVAR